MTTERSYQDDNNAINEYGKIYEKLFSKWEEYKKSVIEHIEEIKLNWYCADEDKTDEMRFNLCNAVCFVRFKCNIKHATKKASAVLEGVIEYGIAGKRDETGNFFKKVITVIKIDTLGNITSPKELSHYYNFKFIHAHILAANIEKLCNTYSTQIEDQS